MMDRIQPKLLRKATREDNYNPPRLARKMTREANYSPPRLVRKMTREQMPKLLRNLTREEMPTRYVEIRHGSGGDRRSMMLKDIFGNSRRGSSNVSSITLTDFDEESFYHTSGSMRWKMDGCFDEHDELQEGSDEGEPVSPRTSGVMSAPVCPSRRSSIDSEKISLRSSQAWGMDIPAKRDSNTTNSSSARPPMMPWRKVSMPKIDCKPEMPGRQTSVSTTLDDESGDDSPVTVRHQLTREMGQKTLLA